MKLKLLSLNTLLFITSILITSSSIAQWSQLGLDIDGEFAGDYSGEVSMSSDGLTVAIGARLNDGNGTYTGHVRVYKFISGTWVQQGFDIDGEHDSDFSGTAVSLSADGLTLAIGAALNSDNGNGSGHVRVFHFVPIAEVWIQKGSDIDGFTEERFGSSVQLSGDGLTLVIGAPFNDANGLDAGIVRIYKFVSGDWIPYGASLLGEAEDMLGSGVSISSDGSTIAIGSPWNDNSNGINAGSVKVYQMISGTWVQQGSNINGDGESDLLGIKNTVSLNADGTIVAVGSINNDSIYSGAGLIKVYKIISGVWTLQGAAILGEAAGDEAGIVSLSDDGLIVAVGSPWNDNVNGINAGSVRVYKFVSGNWVQHGLNINGEAANDRSGGYVSISSDGSTVAIGADGNDDAGTSAGHVRIYKSNQIVSLFEPYFGASFICHPNPTNGPVKIELGQSFDNITVVVSNAIGQVISEKDYSKVSQLQLKIEGDSGIYFVKIQKDGLEKVVKLVKN